MTQQIDELSNEKLSNYKKAAGADASAADKAGDFKRGNKRFSGIVRATKKQFANDLKKEEVEQIVEYGDTAKGQKMLTKVHKRAVNRLIKKDDENMKEPDYTKRDLKTVRKHQATADRAWDRMSEEVAANNVGGGNIAGTQGDAGKKAVMTDKPLKRRKIDFKEFVELEEKGLWDNIHAKRKRIKNGSGERMRKPGEKGAPTDADFKAASESVEVVEYAIDAKGHKSSTGGLTQKGRDSYNAKGGNLKPPVTTPPSKLDPDSKAAKRRKSFCARMGGMEGPMKDEKGRPTRKALALRKWNC